MDNKLSDILALASLPEKVSGYPPRRNGGQFAGGGRGHRPSGGFAHGAGSGSQPSAVNLDSRWWLSVRDIAPAYDLSATNQLCLLA